MFPSSLSGRLVAVAAVWVSVALVVAGLALTAMFRNTIESGFDDVLTDDLHEIISLIAVDEQTGRVHLLRHPVDPRFNKRASGWYWRILADDGWREWSNSLWDQELALPPAGAPPPGKTVTYAATGPGGVPLRVLAYEHVLTDDSAARITILVAGPADKIDESFTAFVNVVILALAVLGLGLIGAVVVQVRYGLKPLRRMIRRLHDIRAGRAARLEESSPSELAPLARELNALLDYNADVIERVRSQAGELAHAMKTSLAVLMNEAERIEGEPGDIVRHHTELMSQRVGAHLSRTRAAGASGVLGARTEIGPVVEDLSRTLRRIFAERSIDIAVDVDPHDVFQGERQDLEEMLGNLLDNACKWAQSQVRVRSERADGALRLIVEDDGPGIPETQLDEVLERGRRLDESTPGSGLGLCIVHNLTELYSGSLTLARSSLGGLAATLSLPGAR